jgi:hypothetical protein
MINELERMRKEAIVELFIYSDGTIYYPGVSLEGPKKTTRNLK